MRGTVIALCVMLLGVAVVGASAPSPAAPAGQTGCAGCHTAGKVRTLDASLKTIPNHPALPAPTVAMCLACHKAQGKAAPLGPILHRRHLASATFAGTFKGTCTSCHAVDTKTGRVTVIGAPSP